MGKPSIFPWRGIVAALLIACSVRPSSAHPMGDFGTSGLRLNEIRITHSGTDRREFIELAGLAGASLTGTLVLVVDGDGVNAGVLDRAWDLSGFTVRENGLFLLGDTLVEDKELDIGAYDAIENGTCTVYLVTSTDVAAVISLLGTRVALDSTTTSLPNVSTILDRIGIADAGYPTLDVIYDGATAHGPDGPYLPAGIVRCADAPFAWSSTFLAYDVLTSGADAPTPGALNRSCDVGLGYCFGDGSGSACPCGNESSVGTGEGCRHSFGHGGKLAATGTASIAQGSVVLRGTNMPDSPALYFQGIGALNAGFGAAFGDGLRCVNGSVIRLGLVTNSGGGSSFPGTGAPALATTGAIDVPGTRYYQIWYRNAAEFCSDSTFNLTNGLWIDWTE